MIGSAFLYYRHEWKAVPLFAGLIVVEALIAGSALDLPLLAAPLLVGGIGGYTFKKERSFGFFLLASSLTLTILIGGYFYYMVLASGVDFFGMLKGQLVAYLEKAGISEDVKGRLLEDFEASRGMVPFSTFFNSVLFSGIGYLMIEQVLTRMAKAVSVKGLDYFRLNDYFVFALIAGLAVFLLVDRKAYPVLNIAGLNLALTVALLYFIQGLGLIKFFLIKRGLPRFILPMSVVVFLTLGPVGIFLAVLLAGFGALDIWADFRKMNEKKED